jgi:hypothetical protein
MAEAGMSKYDAQVWLHEHCRTSLKTLLAKRDVPRDGEGNWVHHREMQKLEEDPTATIPCLESPEQYLLFVTGGSTHYANFFYGTYGIASQTVENI